MTDTRDPKSRSALAEATAGARQEMREIYGVKYTPLTSAELAAIFDGGIGWCSESTFARIRATIEQQREQIERLRKALEYCAVVPAELNPANQAQFMVAREALAATEPSNAKN